MTTKCEKCDQKFESTMSSSAEELKKAHDERIHKSKDKVKK